MEWCCAVILILTISFEVVQAKTFLCLIRIGTNCTIANVTPEDISIVLESQYSSLRHNQYQYISELTITNSKIDEIPPISSTYITLYRLSCVGCGLADITKHSFTHSQTVFRNLSTLDISVGSFPRLQKSVFSSLPLLTHLNVSHGVISEIDDVAFKNLGNLQYLDLSNNNISKVTPIMFDPLESLLHLDISFNVIKVLDYGLFYKNLKISHLNLAYNEINTIDGPLFDSQCFPSSINLSYNELSLLHTMHSNAQEVYANNNRLKHISISIEIIKLIADQNIIQNLTCDKETNRLSILNLANNSVTELGCISSLAQLTELNLSYNKLSELNQSSFAALTALTQLNLKSANVTKPEYGLFSHQSELVTLDLSYNQMGNIGLDVLLAAGHLKHLYIDGNNLTEISYIDLRKTFSGLQTISIADNDFNCTFLSYVIKQLNSDNISTAVSSGSKVTDSHNINGIGCINRKEMSTSSWITNPTKNDNTTDAIIRRVEQLSEDLGAVEQQNYKIINDILTIKSEILRIELQKSINISSTVSSSETLWTQFHQLNNITLEKQQISNRIQMQEINELKFEIAQNSYKISDCAIRIEKLVNELKMLNQASSTETNKNNSSHPDLDIVKNVNIVLITLIVAFCIYKGYQFVRNDMACFTRHNTAHTLHANIMEMDNSSNKLIS